MKTPKFIVLMLIAMLIILPGHAQESGNVTIEGADAESLLKIIEFLIYYGGPGDEVIVTVGKLPQDLPFELGIPDTMKVVGSVNRGTGYGGLELWLTSPVPPEETADLFGDQLLADGWEAPEGIFGRPPGGFTPILNIDQGYCREDQFIHMSVQKRASETAVTLRYDDMVTPPFCVEGGMPQEGYPDAYLLMPTLTLPDGVEMRQEPRGGRGGGGGGGYGPATAETSIVLLSELGADEIASLYYVQLEAIAWQLVEQGGSAAAAWSTWTFTDDEGQEWGSIFTLTHLPATDGEYFAYIRIEQVD